MKKLIITCSLITGLSVIASAQNTKPADNVPVTTPGAPAAPGRPMNGPMNSEQMQQHMAEGQARHLEKQFGLTPEQYKGAYQACLDWAKGVQEMRTPGTAPKPGMREKLEAEKNAKLKKIMTAEQYAKYEATTQRQGPPAPPMPGKQVMPAPGAPPAPPVKN